MAEFIAYVKDVLGAWFTGYWFITAIPEIATWIMSPERVQRATAWLDRTVSPESRQRFYRALLVLGFFFAGYVAWQQQYSRNLTNDQRHAIRLKIARYIAESEKMQGVCQDPKAEVPDVPRWKLGVEQYLETLGHDYVVRFREGVSDAGLSGVDDAHNACFQDLHVRERNLERFMDDFRPVANENSN